MSKSSLLLLSIDLIYVFMQPSTEARKCDFFFSSHNAMDTSMWISSCCVFDRRRIILSSCNDLDGHISMAFDRHFFVRSSCAVTCGLERQVEKKNKLKSASKKRSEMHSVMEHKAVGAKFELQTLRHCLARHASWHHDTNAHPRALSSYLFE